MICSKSAGVYADRIGGKGITVHEGVGLSRVGNNCNGVGVGVLGTHYYRLDVKDYEAWKNPLIAHPPAPIVRDPESVDILAQDLDS